MSERLLLLIALPATLLAAEVKTGPDYIWWEAENADATDLTTNNAFKPQSESEAQMLSGGAWIGPSEETKEGFAEYNIPVGQAGDHIFYARKFWTHGPFRWRFDQQPWQTVGEDVALLDGDEPRKFVCANWVEAGPVTLTKGTHTLRLEAIEKTSPMVLDAFRLSRTPLLAGGNSSPTSA